jgi:hypothetical protein
MNGKVDIFRMEERRALVFALVVLIVAGLALGGAPPQKTSVYADSGTDGATSVTFIVEVLSGGGIDMTDPTVTVSAISPGAVDTVSGSAVASSPAGIATINIPLDLSHRYDITISVGSNIYGVSGAGIATVMHYVVDSQNDKGDMTTSMQAIESFKSIESVSSGTAIEPGWDTTNAAIDYLNTTYGSVTAYCNTDGAIDLEAEWVEPSDTEYDATSPGAYIFTARLLEPIPAGISIAGINPPTVDVIVAPQAITSIAAIDDVSSGTAIIPGFPTTTAAIEYLNTTYASVTAIYTTSGGLGYVGNCTAGAWTIENPETYMPTKAGIYEFTSKVEVPAQYSIAEGIEAKANIVVKRLDLSKVNIAVYNTPHIYTNDTFDLDENLEVSYGGYTLNSEYLDYEVSSAPALVLDGTSIGAVTVTVSAVYNNCRTTGSAMTTFKAIYLTPAPTFGDGEGNYYKMTSPPAFISTEEKLWYKGNDDGSPVVTVTPPNNWSVSSWSAITGPNSYPWGQTVSYSKEGSYTTKAAFKNSNGQITDWVTLPTFGIDETPPTANFSLTTSLVDPWKSKLFGKLFDNNSLVMTVSNISDGKGSGVNLNSDRANIEVYLGGNTDDDAKTKLAPDSASMSAIQVLTTSSFAFTIKVPDQGKGKIEGVLYIAFNDNVGNRFIRSVTPDEMKGGAIKYFLIEKTPPTASLKINENVGAEHRVDNSGDETKKWFAQGDVLMYDIDASDKDSGLGKVVFTLRNERGDELDTIVPDGKYGSHGILGQAAASQMAGLSSNLGTNTGFDGEIYDLSGSGTWQVSVDTSKLIDVGQTGRFTVELSVEDNSGNTLVEKPVDDFYIDNAAPALKSIRFEKASNGVEQLAGDEQLMHDGASEVLKTPYGFFFMTDMTVTATVTDYQKGSDGKEIAGLPGAGLNNVVLTATDLNGGVVHQVTIPHSDAGAYSLMVSAGFKGQITVRAEDNLYDGVVSPNTPNRPNHFVVKHPYGSVLETREKFDEIAVVDIVTDATPYTETEDKGAHKIYNERHHAGAGISVAESFAGIESLRYTRAVPEDSNMDIAPALTVSFNADSVENGVESSDIYNLDRTGIFENASIGMNHYLYTSVDARDDIPTELGVELSDITLSLSLTSMATHSLTYSSEPISIDTLAPRVTFKWDNESVENRKYYKANRTITITVVERNFDPDTSRPVFSGPGASFSGWTHRGDTHTGRVRFLSDGDYKFSFKTVDRAGHTSSYRGGATDEFTIDKTVPVIRVSYDNNSVQNGFYYSSPRTATIDIEEHNFRAGDVEAALSARDNGVSFTPPSPGGYSDSGDHNIATVGFNVDGDFTMRLDYTDLAGNPAVAYPEDSFVVDLKDPEIEFYDVEDKTAYNDVIAPGISYSDTNKDESGVEVTFVGVNTGVYTPNFAQSLVTTTNVDKRLEDIPHVPDRDDIYTMYAKVLDKSGRSSEKEIMFSVNRFGSTFMLDEDDKAYLDERDGYINEERAIGVTEVNVNRIIERSVSLSHDGQAGPLEEGEYQINSTGDDEHWKSYHYEFPAETFSDEGQYELLIHSVDEATNVQDNMNNKRKEPLVVDFVVDKTNPTTVISGITPNGRYRENSKDVIVDSKDNILLEKVFVDVDGNVSEFTPSDFAEGILTYTLSSSNNWQNVTIYSYDKAGNTDKETVSAIRILLTSSLFYQFIRNVPLVIGAVAAVAAVAFLVWWRLSGRGGKRRRAVDNK